MGKYVHIRSFFSASRSLLRPVSMRVPMFERIFKSVKQTSAERRRKKWRKTNCSSSLPRMLVLADDGTDACHHNASVNSTITTKADRSSLPTSTRVPSTMLLHNHSVKYVQVVFFVVVDLYEQIRVFLLLENDIQSSFNHLLQLLSYFYF